MKRKKVFLLALITLCVIAMNANAALILRGTDPLGWQLIYDTDLDITWYDFTNTSEAWQDQVDWAAALTVVLGENTYDDWRLPLAPGCEWDLSCSDSELRHLIQMELGSPLITHFTDGATGETENFYGISTYDIHWLGTEFEDFNGWAYDSSIDVHLPFRKDFILDAIAVRDGDVSTTVPEPSTLLLFGTGLLGIGVFRRKFKG